jgi:UDPglucose 6-dehydrogenase
VSKISVIGAGYVGLTTAACLSSLGHDVCISESDNSKVELIKRGKSPIYEPGLENLISLGLAENRLRIVSNNLAAVKDSDFIFICLPTPQSGDGSANMSIVESFIKSAKDGIPKNCILVTKSTMPVGSTMKLSGLLKRDDVHMVSNPEFLREGTAVYDTLNPERVVIGAANREAAEKVAKIYSSLKSEVIITDSHSAEIVKYAANAFLATKVSFINSISTLCELYDGDINKVKQALGADSRIGSKFLQPGPGWGGSCFPKDTAALVRISDDVGFSFEILKATIESNKNHQRRIIKQILEMIPNGTDGTVGVLGLTFKAGTDDVRDSPSIEIIEQLLSQGVKVNAYDPVVDAANLSFVNGSVGRAGSAIDAARGSDAIVVLSEWSEFADLDPVEMAPPMRNLNVFDVRGIIDSDKWLRCGFTVKVIGKK